MSVKIRLSRFGAKKQPSYRIVVAEERSKRDGRIVEKIGHYDPRTEPPTVVLNEERTKYWLGVGARPTDAMGPILKRAGISDQEALVELACRLFDTRRLTLFFAAKLSGMSQPGFEDILLDRKIAIYYCTETDLENDLKTFQHMRS